MREICIDPDAPQFGPSTCYDAPPHFVRVSTPQFRRILHAHPEVERDEIDEAGVSHRTRGDEDE